MEYALEKVKNCFPRLIKIRADGGYAGTLVDWGQRTCGWILEIVKRGDIAQGFQIPPLLALWFMRLEL